MEYKFLIAVSISTIFIVYLIFLFYELVKNIKIKKKLEKENQHLLNRINCLERKILLLNKMASLIKNFDEKSFKEKTKILATEPGKGKTKTLITISSINKQIIVCRDKKEVLRILEFADFLGLEIPQPITWNDFKQKTYLGKEIKGFLFDGGDDFIKSFSSIPINIITCRK